MYSGIDGMKMFITDLVPLMKWEVVDSALARSGLKMFLCTVDCMR